LLVLAIGIAGLVFNEDAARRVILSEIQSTIGEQAASSLDAMIQNVHGHHHSVWAAIVGLAALLVGVWGVFGELQDSLNTVWKVKPRDNRSLIAMIHQRFLSFAVVVGTGFLLLVSLVASAVLAALGSWLSSRLPGGEVLWRIVNVGISFVTIAILFA